MDDLITSSNTPAPGTRNIIARPEPFIVQPTSTHTHTAILLHGLGSNGEKFGAEFLESAVSSNGRKFSHLLPGTKFIFPTAKKRRSSAFKRATINQWFNIASIKDPSKRGDLQLEGLVESAEYVGSILRREIEEISANNIILGGLSQGCAMALMILLIMEVPLGGFVGMSGWLPFREDIDGVLDGESDEDGDGDGDVVTFEESEGREDQDPPIRAINLVRDLLSLEAIECVASDNSSTSLETPVFLGHGEQDEKIECILGKQAANTLTTLGMDVTWKSYPKYGHWYKIPDEIDDVLSFLHAKGWNMAG